MKAAFNGTCENCRLFGPRRVLVCLVAPRGSTVYDRAARVICEDCRKKLGRRCRLAHRHE